MPEVDTISVIIIAPPAEIGQLQLEFLEKIRRERRCVTIYFRPHVEKEPVRGMITVVRGFSFGELYLGGRFSYVDESGRKKTGPLFFDAFNIVEKIVVTDEVESS
jgi:hypothetical protein